MNSQYLANTMPQLWQYHNGPTTCDDNQNHSRTM